MVKMLIPILGNLGAGKTVLMVIFSFYSDKLVVSNFDLFFTHKKTEPFEINKFLSGQYENCIILLDEAYTYLESRVPASELVRIMGYILMQSRKSKVDLYLTAQLLSSIDKRYRELSDYFIVADSRKNEYDDFTYHLSDKNQYFTFKLDYLKVLPFFELYNTNQKILTTNPKILFDTKNSDEKEEEINNYANIIEEYYENEGLTNITKSMVQLYATTKKVPHFLVESIYAELKIRKKKKEKV